MKEEFEGLVEKGSEEEQILQKIDFSRIPVHVAIIMDGNGRWAKMRNLPRIEGHRAGINSVRIAVETAYKLGIKYLTLYAFSKENWKRPKSEIDALMTLLEEYLEKEEKKFLDEDIRFRTIGRIGELPAHISIKLRRLEELTKNKDKMYLIIALNYGGRTEIVDAVNRILREKSKVKKLDEKIFSKYLYTEEIPDPDLLIRTSGEQRISNFLLWQIAYTELWITSVLWPDFSRKDFLMAIKDFQSRERRFGGIKETDFFRGVNDD
ncbi:MAG: isoprenyl transferase [Candidatus Aminicenantia bacterium]